MKISSVNNNYKQSQNDSKQDLAFGMIRISNASTALYLQNSKYLPKLRPLENVNELIQPNSLNKEQIKRLKKIFKTEHCFMTFKEYKQIKQFLQEHAVNEALTYLEKKVNDAVPLTKKQLLKIGTILHKKAKQIVNDKNQLKSEIQNTNGTDISKKVERIKGYLKSGRERFKLIQFEIRYFIENANAKMLQSYKEPPLIPQFMYKKYPELFEESRLGYPCPAPSSQELEKNVLRNSINNL